MFKGLVVTPEIQAETLSDGTAVYTAGIAELPGIVTEGETEGAAMSELIASVRHLREQLGVTAVGFRTTAVPRWQWVASVDAERQTTFGTEEVYAPPTATV
jgi:hypothetical protein